ncbi:MAG: SDR family oxidoreductase [Deltaproteobacteria bacterium]|nr:SDR family oxidoreductase [Deltaproteobacteria bacterium]
MSRFTVTANLQGQNALVTGANTGIGLVTARELARAGARVWLACRSRDKGQAAIAQIRAALPTANLEFLALDLGSLQAVRRSAQEFLDLGVPLHLLVNNAGLAGSRGLTSDGFELHFGTNHLGPYLLTRLLLPALQAAGTARVVCVASKAHYDPKKLDFDAVRRSTPTVAGFKEYGVSKLCNVLFAKALAKRLAGTGIAVYSLHPGVVASDIWRRVPQPFRWLALQFMLTTDQGAETSLYCATEPSLAGESGLYYDNCAQRKPSRLARDEALAEALWQKSAEWVGLPA